MRRPLGVTILGFLAILMGIIGILGGCMLMGFGSLLAPIGALFGGGQLGSSAFAGGLGWAVSAVIALIAGFGALALKGWAWILGLLASGLSLASALWGILQGSSWFFSAPGLILPAVVFIYLLTPGVRKAFGRA